MARTVQLRQPVIAPEVLERTRRDADVLRPFVGKYVAQRHGVVLVASDTPAGVFAWLKQRRVRDAAVFLVPTDPVAATNVA